MLEVSNLRSSQRAQHVLLLSLLLVPACLDLPAQQLPIKSYATADGLAHNRVNKIVKDSRGYLWFCTAGGLSRFDGYAFTNFGTEQGLPNSSVNDILETRSGEYWVATEGGLVHFDPNGRRDHRVVYESAEVTPAPMFTVVVPDSEDKQSTRATTVLLEGRDGTIWAGTNAGLYRLDHVNGRRLLRPVDVHIPSDFPEQRIIADLLEDSHGSLWIAAPSGLYRRWPDGSAVRYTRRDGLPGDYVQDLLEDHEGWLWAGTRTHGFFRFRVDGTPRAPVVDLKFIHAPSSPNDLPSATSWVYQLFETSDHRFWVATARGLVEFFPSADERHRFRSWAPRNGLTDNGITALNEDLGGNLWLGTTNSGVMKLTRGGFSTYDRHDGIESLNAMFEDRAGHLCFRGNLLGDARGYTVFDGAKLDVLRGDQAFWWARLGCLDGQRFDWFFPAAVARGFGWVMEDVTLQARNGEWWVGTGEGLFRFPVTDRPAQLRAARPLAVYTAKNGLALPQVFRLFEDSRGNIWISTIDAATNGLARWESSDERIHDLAGAPGLPSLKENLPRSFGEDLTGNIWIGFDSSLVRYAGGRFTSFAASEGLPPDKIRNIYVDHSGRLWLASDGGGLVRVDNAGGERPTFVSYTTAQGLSSNNVRVIVEDVSGRLYVGGGHGLDRFDPVTGRVKQFTTADGLAPGIIVAAFRDRSGVLWFGMSSGLTRLAPAIEKPPAAPPVFVTGLRVSGLTRAVSAVGERKMSLPDLAPDQNQLQIDFVGLGFGLGDVLRYQYKLEGADADWSALGEQRTVTYASLAPGGYRFIVRAMSSDGIVSDPPASIAFKILRPYWLRWWFLTLAAIALTFLLYALYRYRVTRLLEMANLRTHIATDLHDDIGANLTRIALLSEAAQQARNTDRDFAAAGPLASIAHIARESVISMSDIVWAINPKRESLLDLVRRMRQHADEIFTQRAIELRFNAPGPRESLKVGMDVRRDLLLIFKEAVSNAARHSQCSRVEIDLRIVESSGLILTVADNGVGFDQSIESEGHGIASLQRRAQRLNGTLDITSRMGVGTTVRLSTSRNEVSKKIGPPIDLPE